jgi:hypothetical protein
MSLPSKLVLNETVKYPILSNAKQKLNKIRRSSWRAKPNSIFYNEMWKKKKDKCPEYNSIMQVIFYSIDQVHGPKNKAIK